MGIAMIVYRPRTTIVSARADRAFPRELHVHDDGQTFAIYDGRPSERFRTMYDALEQYGLTPADLEQIP